MFRHLQIHLISYTPREQINGKGHICSEWRQQKAARQTIISILFVFFQCFMELAEAKC